MFKNCSTLATFAFIAMLSAPADAQAPPTWTQVGVLNCRLNPSIGFIIAGHQTMEALAADDGAARLPELAPLGLLAGAFEHGRLASGPALSDLQAGQQLDIARHSLPGGFGGAEIAVRNRERLPDGLELLARVVLLRHAV